MERAIDAEKYMELLKEQYLHYKAMKHGEAARAWQGAMQLLYDMPTLTPPNEWVSVEERLPTDERPVLVFVGYADTMTGFITTSSYFCFDANPHWQWDGLVRDEQRTLFWMPLPAPPGEDNNVPTNKPLTLERVAKEFLVICGNDCVGDPSVGIPHCPFFQFKDVEDNGAIIDPKCELAAYRRPPEGEEDNNDGMP